MVLTDKWKATFPSYLLRLCVDLKIEPLMYTLDLAVHALIVFARVEEELVEVGDTHVSHEVRSYKF